MMDHTAPGERRDEIAGTLEVLFEPGQIVELRAFHTTASGITISRIGYFTDRNALVDTAVGEGSNEWAIYVTLNQIDPSLLSKANNRMVEGRAGGATSDKDVVQRRWLPIDLDPVRSSGVASTDDEHRLAIDKAHEICRVLTEEGWPRPIVADSGNGAYVLFRIDIPAADDGLVKRVLEWLAFRFSDEHVNVDLSVHNPARLCRLFGTMNCKGEHTDDRPHRYSKILSVPDVLTPVRRDLLDAAAALSPSTRAKGVARPSKKHRVDIDAFLAEHDLDVDRVIPYNGGRLWVLRRCPWDESHTNKSAFIMEFPNGGLHAACHHTNCPGKSWPALRDVVEPGWRSRSSAGDDDAESGAAADRLVRIALDSGLQLFHDQSKEAFARIPVGDHYEIRRCEGKEFKQWLRHRYFLEHNKVPNSDAINAAVALIGAKALFEGEQHTLHNRVALHDGCIYYDLCDKEWRAVRIGPDGWEVVSDPPILFYRQNHQRPQVEPVRGGCVEDLLEFVNLRDQSMQLLLIVYVIACLQPEIAHPVPILYGPQGSAKTSLFRLLRRIVDPSALEVMSFPGDGKELVQQLSHHWMPLYDNLTKMTVNTSDTLCRVVTGEGFSKRELYTNDDDVIYSFRCCLGLNGINIIAQKADLLDRSIVIELDSIPHDERKSEQEMWDAFDRAKAAILGAVFDVLSAAMKIRPNVKLEQLPRMADFAIWGCAIAEALGRRREDFLAAFGENEQIRNQEALDASPVAAAVVVLMETTGAWEGEMSKLLSKLCIVAATSGINTRSWSWPRAAHILSRRLKEAETNLKAEGIHIEWPSSGRQVRIWKDGS